jgi:hypothetical protein
MRAPYFIAALALTTLAVAACSNPDAGAGSRICTPFADASAKVDAAASPPGAAQPFQAPVDPAAALDDCLHRWSYTLAAASDRAQDVAQAAVAACTPALTRWNQQTLAPPGARGRGAAVAAPSLLTGQATTPIAEHYIYAQARALFYVVQGRAGKCPPPAVSAK